MSSAGLPGLSPVEVMILHTIRHRDRPKKLSDICLSLGIEDTHVVNYAVRKLEAAELVVTGRVGKEKSVIISAIGAEACARYAEIRERLFVASAKRALSDEDSLSDIAAVLRFLSGAYEQAARSAITL